MKVLFIKSSTRTHGGGSKAFMQMLYGLIALGVTPMVILPDKKGLYTTLRSMGVACVTLRYRMSVYPWTNSLKDKFLFIPRLLGRMIVNNLAVLQIIPIVKQFKPDIIHTNVSVIAIGYYVARLLKIPHVWHIREYGALNLQTFYYYPTFKHQKLRYKKQNSYTICITKDIQRYNSLLNHVNSTVIYDGVLPANAIDYVSQKKPYFLYVGRLEYIKGILPLIDAYANYYQTHPSPLPLYIAGSGEPKYTELVITKLQKYGIEHQVKMLGMIDDVLPYYKEAKALIVPSLFEGFGFITAEAMFSGCLVIGNDVAGTKEQFDNGKEFTGEEIALRYATQEQLVQHLNDVTNKKTAHYQSMIDSAQQVVAKLYTSEEHSKQIYDYYQYILGL